MQGIFRKENTDKALKYGIYRHLPTYEKIIRNLVSFYKKKMTRYLQATPTYFLEPQLRNIYFHYPLNGMTKNETAFVKLHWKFRHAVFILKLPRRLLARDEKEVW